MKKVFNILANIITICLLIFVVGFLTLSIIGIKPYIVLSGSMEPNIHTGSLCFINQKVEYEDIKENQVIAFKSVNNQLVTHRVINITEEGFETKGDNNDVSDGISTTKDNFVGLNIFAIPYLGYVSQFLQTKQGMIITCVGIIVLYILNMIVNELFSNKKDEQKE